MSFKITLHSLIVWYYVYSEFRNRSWIPTMIHSSVSGALHLTRVGAEAGVAESSEALHCSIYFIVFETHLTLRWTNKLSQKRCHFLFAQSISETSMKKIVEWASNKQREKGKKVFQTQTKLMKIKFSVLLFRGFVHSISRYFRANNFPHEASLVASAFAETKCFLFASSSRKRRVRVVEKAY